VQSRQNNTFRSCPGKLYDLFKAKGPTNSTIVDKSEVFWDGIWGASRLHNASARWLSDLSRKHSQLPEQAAVFISSDDVSCQAKQMSNLKSPGLYPIVVYWLKNLTSIHS